MQEVKEYDLVLILGTEEAEDLSWREKKTRRTEEKKIVYSFPDMIFVLDCKR